jgi:hypothetical protein
MRLLFVAFQNLATRPQQEMLREAHARMRQHFNARILEVQPARTAFGREEFINRNSARCVATGTMSRLRKRRSASQGGVSEGGDVRSSS